MSQCLESAGHPRVARGAQPREGGKQSSVPMNSWSATQDSEPSISVTLKMARRQLRIMSSFRSISFLTAEPTPPQTLGRSIRWSSLTPCEVSGGCMCGRVWGWGRRTLGLGLQSLGERHDQLPNLRQHRERRLLRELRRHDCFRKPSVGRHDVCVCGRNGGRLTLTRIKCESILMS